MSLKATDEFERYHEGRVGIMSFPIEKPRWNVAHKTAKELVENYSSPPIPVLEIAEQSGVNVVFTNFGAHAEKVAGFCDFAEARIYVNEADKFGRQMFTMAHELGHWLLHKDFFLESPQKYPMLPRFQKTEKSNVFELEANFFAANLLVPRHLLLPVKDAPVSVLANIFNVSREMMENRLRHV